METMKAFWRYDWTLNRGRLIALAVIAALSPLAGIVSRSGLDSGSALVIFFAAFTGFSILLFPVLLLGYVSNLGRTGAPLDFRHFSHLLPIEPGKWALAKVVSVIVLGVLIPAALWLGMSIAVVCLSARAVFLPWQDLMPLLLSCQVIVSFVAAGAVWVMLFESLMPRAQDQGSRLLTLGLCGVGVFFCAELLVHGVTSIRSLEKAVTTSLPFWKAACEAGLLLVLVVAIGLIYVRYCQNRRLGQVLLLALGTLVVVDAARALLWW